MSVAQEVVLMRFRSEINRILRKKCFALSGFSNKDLVLAVAVTQNVWGNVVHIETAGVPKQMFEERNCPISNFNFEF